MGELRERLIRRQNARKKAGVNQTYPQHRREKAVMSARHARVALPCIHEGPIVEVCKSCNSEARHVRACLHPSPSTDRDTCTRGYVSDKVMACERCPEYKPCR